jgi:hypothetical protein
MVAVFPDRWLALLAAAVLPGTGRDPMLRLHPEPEPDGTYAGILDDGTVVGWFQLFDEPLLDGLNLGVGLARSPESLAYLLEATGKVGLERCGAILDSRLPAVEGEPGM